MIDFMEKKCLLNLIQNKRGWYALKLGRFLVFLKNLRFVSRSRLHCHFVLSQSSRDQTLSISRLLRSLPEEKHTSLVECSDDMVANVKKNTPHNNLFKK